jgi:hypothetical protein
MKAPLYTATLIGTALLINNEALACVIVGGPLPEECMTDMPGQKNCRCLTIRNTCTVDIQVRYEVIGGAGQMSMPLPSGKVSMHTACTTRSNQTVQYLGYDIR